ncbi:hypothetical protein K458DRAFT_201102 [Lentithecium fluviatile CBS 122367]|uniref:Uncharacterized protein n=1 Tax=Lentithecium fluviatile CBS 122367 TaxID=1168545 RepID=A0A6G1J818_9PLEO|nr:hypothetical protein K458DRAFT_201102 [Lentithecium fluviatile CBS 122367]
MAKTKGRQPYKQTRVKRLNERQAKRSPEISSHELVLRTAEVTIHTVDPKLWRHCVDYKKLFSHIGQQIETKSFSYPLVKDMSKSEFERLVVKVAELRLIENRSRFTAGQNVQGGPLPTLRRQTTRPRNAETSTETSTETSPETRGIQNDTLAKGHEEDEGER